MRQSGAPGPTTWAGAGHEFLLLRSQALRFHGKNFAVGMVLAIAYEMRELGIFFTPDPCKVFQ